MTANWLVVGAGPAGIATVGTLLDLGHEVTWVDPSFTVGRFGTYGMVPSNTRVSLFVRYLQACRSFEAEQLSGFKKLCALPQDLGCQLSVMIECLRQLTAKLLVKVKHYRVDEVVELLDNCAVTGSGEELHFDKAALCIGGHPRSHPCATVSIDEAMNPAWLKKDCQSEVAVVGSSHTACLIMKHLDELGIPCLNIYRNPLKFAIYHTDGRIEWDNTGLKGEVAEWAREMHRKPMIRRVQCDGDWSDLVRGHEHVVAAIGFDPNYLSNGNYSVLRFGMAGPERGEDGPAIGLWKFMSFIQRTLNTL